MIVSVIILAYNRASEVLITLKKLTEMQPTLPFDLEILVVDNASSDKTSAEVKAAYPDVILLRKLQNSGIAGWNAGFLLATGKYFLVLDDDSCIESGFSDAIAYLEQHPKVGILALNIVDQQLQGDPLLPAEDGWKHEEDIPGFIGCGAIITKEVYDTIGGFADWIHVYTHEFEYSIRALEAGFEIKFFKDALVVHRASQLNRSKRNHRIYACRNELAIVHAYFNTSRLKYLLRTFFNNLKVIKREGVASGWYIFLGFVQFLKLKKQLQRTPVSNRVQQFYATKFWSTKPVFKS